eukprot:171173-Prymnesium_polylepis.2
MGTAHTPAAATAPSCTAPVVPSHGAPQRTASGRPCCCTRRRLSQSGAEHLAEHARRIVGPLRANASSVAAGSGKPSALT